MGFSLSKTFKKVKTAVKKVAKPFSYLNPLTYIGYGSDPKALAGYAGAAGLAGGAATILGGLGGATSAASLGKGGASVVGADAALGGGSTLGALGSGLGTLANSASSIAPFLSAAGSGYAGYASAGAQKEINDKQLAWAREQSQIQQNASATQYQRAMKDMEKAGLNPILAYQQGGAAMPGTVQAPQLGNPVAAGVNSASAVQSAFNQTAQTNSNVALQHANTALTQAKTALSENLIPGTDAIATITTHVADLVGVAAELLPQGANEYRGVLDEVKSTVQQLLNKASTVGGNAQEVIVNVYGELKEKGIEITDKVKNYFEEDLNDWEHRR